MYLKKTGLVIITSVLFFISNSFSQVEVKPKEEKTYNNSGGIDYRFVGSNSSDIGLTYRRFFEESKYNLKASFYFGGDNRFLERKNMLIFPTSDSTQLGVYRNLNYRSNHQRLEVGLERKLKFRNVNVVAGADVLIGLQNLYFSERVSEAYELIYDEYGSLDSDYYFNPNKFAEGERLNTLQTTRNSLIFGVGANLGILIDITNRFYASAFLGFKFTGNTLLNEDFNYQNETYKEHLTKSQLVSTLNFDQNLYLGLHYRF